MVGWDPHAAALDYFSTAAGPSLSDLVGPSSALLNIYPDGQPISQAEQAVANGVGGGGGKWYQRADVHAAALMVLGGWMIHSYLREG